MLTVEDTNFDWKNINLVDCLEGNALDTYFTLKIFNHLKNELDKRNVSDVYAKILAPITRVFAEIEYHGLDISVEELEKLDKQLTEKLGEIVAELNSISGDDSLNLGSTKDLTKLLYSCEKNPDTDEFSIINYGFGLYPPGRTDKGAPSTDVDTLKLLDDFLSEEVVKRGLNK